MRPPPHDEDSDHARLDEIGLEYHTELTVQYLKSIAEAHPPDGLAGKLKDTERQADRNVVWFELDGVEMSVSVYLGSPAVCVGVDTKIAYHDFQPNAAWILRTCADFGVGIDLDVDEKTGETWMFLFLRVFWAGYNYEVLEQACDDLLQCRKALEARVAIRQGSK